MHPKMGPFIVGHRSQVHIIDLEKTVLALRRAVYVVREVAAAGGIVLFVVKRPSLRDKVERVARESGQYFVSKWSPGTLTNSKETLFKGTRLSMHDKDQLKPFAPDVVVVFDPVDNLVALREAARMKTPSIAIIDTNMNPELVTYPIPGNDEAASAQELYINVLGNAAKEGMQLFQTKDPVLFGRLKKLQEAKGIINADEEEDRKMAEEEAANMDYEFYPDNDEEDALKRKLRKKKMLAARKV